MEFLAATGEAGAVAGESPEITETEEEAMARRILIVDDEPDILKFLTKLLSSQGYLVVTATNGLEALEKVEEEKPDAIILDVLMPGLDGWETLKRLKENEATGNIPVIMLTSQSKDQDIMKGYGCGADYYVTKPFTPSSILAGLTMMFKEDKEAPKKYEMNF